VHQRNCQALQGGHDSTVDQRHLVFVAAVVLASLVTACTGVISTMSPGLTSFQSLTVAPSSPPPARASPQVRQPAGSAAPASPIPSAAPRPAPSATAPSAPPSPSPIRAAALRTFPVAAGQTVCPQFVLANALRGVLEGSPSDPREPVWLRGPSGARSSVVWPTGFSVRFEPTAVLYNERGRAVAKAGSDVILPQVALGSHAGTFADPYVAAGLLFGACYEARL